MSYNFTHRHYKKPFKESLDKSFYLSLSTKINLTYGAVNPKES